MVKELNFDDVGESIFSTTTIYMLIQQLNDCDVNNCDGHKYDDHEW